MLQIPSRPLALFAIALPALGALPAAAQTINENLKLTASDGAVADIFGHAVAIGEGLVAAGAVWDDDFGRSSGSVYLFDMSTGVQLFKLLPNDGAELEAFGASVAIDNGVLAVGKAGDTINGTSSGSAYLFDTSTGEQLFKLIPSDGGRYNNFGMAIAIDDGIVAVGAYGDDDNGYYSGSVYLFDASTGVELFKLTASDGQWYDQFGLRLALDNGIIAIGAPMDLIGSNSGCAYLFDVSTGTQIAKLLPTDGQARDQFGSSIDIHNGIVAVGSPHDDDNGNESGSAYLFDASTGEQIAKLLPSDSAELENFGDSIAIHNGVVAVGKIWDDDNGDSSGSAYLFDASTGEQIAKLLTSDGAEGDRFGNSIDIDNGVIAVGAFYDDGDNGGDSGSAYLFTIPTPCPADLNGDGTLNFFDISAFLSAFNTQDPAADFTDDGLFNFFDVSDFLSAFDAGCP